MRLAKRGDDIVLVQEPWTNHGTILGLAARATNYCTLQTQVEPPPGTMVAKAANAARMKGIPYIIGADANAHHQLWGSLDTNRRGEDIIDFVLINNLVILNKGNWRVSDDFSFSDHRYLEFSISGADRTFFYRNRRRTDWETHCEILSDVLAQPPTINNVGEIEESVRFLSNAFRHATERACRVSFRRENCRPPWWTAEIAELRQKCRRLFNEAKRTGNWTLYKASTNKFKNLTRNAKRRSWRDFCGNVRDISETSRLRKILAKQPTVPSFIRKADGSWSTSCRESLEQLIDTHFPGNRSVTMGETSLLSYDRGTDCMPITEDMLRWAITSFYPYKSPGPDGIIPADLQHNMDVIIPWLLEIYGACLLWSYIPVEWTRSNVTFIPKGGRSSHMEAKDYRPISLTSFLLKTLERIMDLHLRSTIDDSYLSPSQHAYTKGRSVETALHSLVGHIEKANHYGNFTMVAFMDIEGAFNNVDPMAVVGALEQLGVDQSTVQLISRMLMRRTITSRIGATSVTREVCRGTPQRGVLSPLLWNVVVNRLLMNLDFLLIKTVAYADDVAIAVSGGHPESMARQLEYALRIVSDWGQHCGLRVNPAKTELVLFGRKYKVPPFAPPKLDGVLLALANRAKFLGVIFDSRLTWKENIRARAAKAISAIYVCKRAIGRTWGLRPNGVLWLYEMVVKPILFYGVTVWWQALDPVSNRLLFERVARTVAILTTGAMRTTPTKALFAILNWLPVDLTARQLAARTALRLCATGMWNPRPWGHASILENAGVRDVIPDLIDYCTPKPFLTRRFITSIWDEAPMDPASIRIYTDGSRVGERVGGGVYIENFNVMMCFRLTDGCSVLQAEISAIRRAAKWLMFYRILGPIY
ncbi:Retrovirus-related Pol polyprotein from type-1 retrotransposable element R1 [Eumeta japonica]|uniref:Retrovirus-related Pol polyprotein from type-1 retrotransposable element R1 n=1 Tax=Eumeta variegata TaxID=151549 RepID=A0A4C1T3K3_EUMVA|nr:Retrovirus-related Pol polyprotein from type-1 retrotransposable element R1 [Eumeta japonica]